MSTRCRREYARAPSLPRGWRILPWCGATWPGSSGPLIRLDKESWGWNPGLGFERAGWKGEHAPHGAPNASPDSAMGSRARGLRDVRPVTYRLVEVDIDVNPTIGRDWMLPATQRELVTPVRTRSATWREPTPHAPAVDLRRGRSQGLLLVLASALELCSRPAGASG